MNVLVIHAHPQPDSFNAALHRTVLESLRAAGHAVTDFDLYAEDFDPRLSRVERDVYHDLSLNQRGKERYVAMLRAAEAVVFVYPVWSFGLPAILKGFFDRLLMPGVAFDIDGGLVTPKLTNIRRIVGVTTYGRAWWMVKFSVGDLPRAQITKYFRWFCHKRAKADYLALYHMNVADEAARKRFIAKVAKTMTALN